MPITITGPAGHEITFPDGTSEDDIASAFDQVSGTEKPSWLSSMMSSPAAGVAKAAGTGLVKGAIKVGSTPGDIEDLANRGFGKALHYAFPNQVPEGTLSSQALGALPEAARPAVKTGTKAVMTAFGANPTTSEENIAALKGAGVPFHEPQTTPERYAATAAEFVPGALAAPAESIPAAAMNALRFGVLPGLASTAAGDVATKATQNHPNIQPYAVPAAQLGGAMLAPGALSKIVSPNAARLAPNMERHAAVLRAEGITPTAGDVLADRGLRNTESELRPDIAQNQLRDFTRAVGRRIQLDSPNVTIGTGGNLPERRKQIGDQWDTVLGRNDFGADPKLYQDLIDTHDFYHRTPGLYDDSVVSAVDGTLGRVSKALGANKNQMSAKDYQTLRSDLRSAAMSSDDPNKTGELHDITNALDDAFERHLQRTGSSDAAAMPNLRKQYRALLTVEDARVRQGGGTAQDVITPANLQSADKKIYGNMAHEQGKTPFSDLSEAGAALLTPRPDSGTPGRLGVHERASKIARAVTAPLGFLAGQHISGGSEGGVGGLLIGEALSPALEGATKAGMRATTTSAPAQWRLSNRAVPYLTPDQQALVHALAGARALQQGGPPPAGPPVVNVSPRQGYFPAVPQSR